MGEKFSTLLVESIELIELERWLTNPIVYKTGAQHANP